MSTYSDLPTILYYTIASTGTSLANYNGVSVCRPSTKDRPTSIYVLVNSGKGGLGVKCVCGGGGGIVRLLVLGGCSAVVSTSAVVSANIFR